MTVSELCIHAAMFFGIMIGTWMLIKSQLLC